MTKTELLNKMDPELRAVYELLQPYALTPYETLEPFRAGSLSYFRSQPSMQQLYPDIRLTVTEINGGTGNPHLSLRIYEPENRTSPSPVVMNCHGGGCVLYSAEEDDIYCADMARQQNCVVISVDYRLAPEHPAPAGQEDCVSAWKWICQEGAQKLDLDLNHSLFYGGSGGGNMVIGTALRLLDNNKQLPSAIVALYPMLDDRNTTASSYAIEDTCIWGREQNLAAWNYYLNGTDSSGQSREADCYIAPARRSDFKGFPPTLTIVGDLDLFHDETENFAQCLKNSGVDVDYTCYPGCYHCFDRYAPTAKVTQQANTHIATYIDRILHH